MQIYKEYQKILIKLGIKKGDIIYLASDLLQTLAYFNKKKLKFDFDRFINTFINHLGDEGTLAIPTFNWDFCAGKTFDLKESYIFLNYLKYY